MDEGIKFTVIIPTRERADTLYHSLRSVVAQDYGNLNILVSDNFSGDGTREVVQSFPDARIRYINTGRRLAMHENWEFALAQVSGGYVTIIGDDDALLPHALRDMAGLIQDSGQLALSWIKAEYCWPNHPLLELKNRLVLPLVNQIVRFRAADVLRDLGHFLFPYSRTPTLYNSVVSHEVISRARAGDGAFFKAVSPDVYSGIAALSVLDSYILSTRPFSVNGASASSNGTAFSISGADKSAHVQFLQELSSYRDYLFGRVRGSVMTEVIEALMQANRHVFQGKIKINRAAAIYRIVSEMASRGEVPYRQGMEDLAQIVRREHLAGWFRLCQWFRPPSPPRPSEPALIDSNLMLTVDARELACQNVFDAAMLSARILGPYRIPASSRSYSLAKRIASLGLRKLERTGIKATLPL